VISARRKAPAGSKCSRVGKTEVSAGGLTGTIPPRPHDRRKIEIDGPVALSASYALGNLKAIFVQGWASPEHGDEICYAGLGIPAGKLSWQGFLRLRWVQGRELLARQGAAAFFEDFIV
jgi:hypothetical protein